MSKSTNICQTGKTAVNRAAKLHHLSSRLKKSFEYFFTSMQNKIRKTIVKLSKNISAGIEVYFAKKYIR